MEDLARFWPRLTGILADLDRIDFPLFEGIELTVEAADFAALSRHLQAIGYTVERARREGQIVLEVEGLEPFVVWPREQGETPALSLPELGTGLEGLYGQSFWTRARLARRE